MVAMFAHQPVGARYGSLPARIAESLRGIEPSRDGEMLYHPCRAIVSGGIALNAVYIAPEVPYLRHWGIFPEDDRGKFWIPIEAVEAVEESPMRLPAEFANQIYRSGESGMGYAIFTVIFADGTQQTNLCGNAVDFIDYPRGKGPGDVRQVIAHQGRWQAGMVKGPRYYWCLYSEGGL